MSDSAWSQNLLTEVEAGRHAVDDDAALTPIFHALSRGGWTTRHEESAPMPDPVVERDRVVDPVETFHRDPLGAPLPDIAVVPSPVADAEQAPGGRRRTGAHAVSEVRRGGRHHRRFVPLDGGAVD